MGRIISDVKDSPENLRYVNKGYLDIFSIMQAWYGIISGTTAGVHISFLENPLDSLQIKAAQGMPKIRVLGDLYAVLVAIIARVWESLVVIIIRKPTAVSLQHRSD